MNDEQLFKDFIATAQANNYNYDVVMPKFPELQGYDLQVLKDYIATAEANEYDYGVVNPKFPELFGEKKKDDTESVSEDGSLELPAVEDLSEKARNIRSVARLNPDGSESTVLMASMEVDGNNVAVPTLFPKDPNNVTSDPDSWMELDGMEAYETALERGEVFNFGSPEEANDFAEGSWKQQAEEQPRTESDEFFEMALEGVTPEVIGRTDDDDTVMEMNNLLGQYGFSFETANILGDAMTVTAKNGETLRVDLDPWRSKTEVAEAAKLNNFLKQNRKESENLLKQEDDYQAAKLKFANEKQIDERVNQLNTDMNSFQQFSRELAEVESAFNEKYAGLDKYTEEYLRANPEEFDEYKAQVEAYNAELQGINDLRGQLQGRSQELLYADQEINRAAAEFVEVQGGISTLPGLVKTALARGTAIMARGMTDFVLDASSPALLMDMRNNENYGAQFLQTYDDMGGSVPEEATKDFDSWYEGLPDDLRHDVDMKMFDDMRKAQKYGGKELEESLLIDEEGKEFIGEGLGERVYDGIMWATGEDQKIPYAYEMAQQDWWGGSILGAIESIPAFVGLGKKLFTTGFKAASRTARMFGQVTDHVDQEFRDNPELRGVTEQDKLKLKVPLGATVAVLENLGFRNVMANKGFASGILMRVLGRSSLGVGQRSFRETVALEVNNAMARGLLTLGNAGAAEFETGFAQELADIGAKEVWNALSDNPDLDTPALNEILGQLVNAGAQEAVGSFVLGTPAAAGAAFQKADYASLSDEQLAILDFLSDPGNRGATKPMIAAHLKSLVNQGNLTGSQAKEALDGYEGTVQALDGIRDVEGMSSEQKRKALALEVRKQELERRMNRTAKPFQKRLQSQIDDLVIQQEELADAIQEPSTRDETEAGPEVEKKGVVERMRDRLQQRRVRKSKEEYDKAQARVAELEEAGATEEDVKDASNEAARARNNYLRTTLTEEQNKQEVELDNERKRLWEEYESAIGTKREAEAEAAWKESADKQTAFFDSIEAGPEVATTEELEPTVEEEVTPEEDTATEDEAAVEEEAAELEAAFAAEGTPDRTETTEAGVDVQRQEGSELTKKQQRVVDQANNVLTSLKSLIPDIKVIAHQTQLQYEAATGMGGRGTYVSDGKTIHINLSRANSRTAFHEAFHAIFLEQIKDGDPDAQEKAKVLLNTIAKALPPKSVLKNRIDRFLTQYDQQDISEEALAEVFSYIANGYSGLGPQVKAKIKVAIKNLIESVLGRKLGASWSEGDQAVLDAMEILAGKVERGEAITSEDVGGIEVSEEAAAEVKAETEVDAAIGRIQELRRKAVGQANDLFGDLFDLMDESGKGEANLFSIAMRRLLKSIDDTNLKAIEKKIRDVKKAKKLSDADKAERVAKLEREAEKEVARLEQAREDAKPGIKEAMSKLEPIAEKKRKEAGLAEIKKKQAAITKQLSKDKKEAKKVFEGEELKEYLAELVEEADVKRAALRDEIAELRGKKKKAEPTVVEEVTVEEAPVEEVTPEAEPTVGSIRTKVGVEAFGKLEAAVRSYLEYMDTLDAEEDMTRGQRSTATRRANKVAKLAAELGLTDAEQAVMQNSVQENIEAEKTAAEAKEAEQAELKAAAERGKQAAEPTVEEEVTPEAEPTVEEKPTVSEAEKRAALDDITVEEAERRTKAESLEAEGRAKKDEVRKTDAELAELKGKTDAKSKARRKALKEYRDNLGTMSIDEAKAKQQPKAREQRVVYHVTLRRNKSSIQSKGLEKGRMPMWTKGVKGIDIFDTANRSFVFSDLNDALLWARKTRGDKEAEVSIVAVNAAGKNLQEDTALTQDPLGFGAFSSAQYTEDVISPSDILNVQDVTIKDFGKTYDESGNPFTQDSFGLAPKAREQRVADVVERYDFRPNGSLRESSLADELRRNLKRYGFGVKQFGTRMDDFHIVNPNTGRKVDPKKLIEKDRADEKIENEQRAEVEEREAEKRMAIAEAEDLRSEELKRYQREYVDFPGDIIPPSTLSVREQRDSLNDELSDEDSTYSAVKFAKERGFSNAAILKFRPGSQQAIDAYEAKENRLKEEIKGVIVKATQRIRGDKDIQGMPTVKQRDAAALARLENDVLRYLQKSKFYQNASDVGREAMVRGVKKQLGINVKSAPSANRLLNGPVDKNGFSEQEKKGLRDQIRAMARSSKTTATAISEARKQIAKDVAKLRKDGVLTTAQATALLNRMARTNPLNEASVNSFIEYADKVFMDADYAKKMNDLNKMRKRALKYAEEKTGINIDVIDAIRTIAGINAEAIPEEVLKEYTEVITQLSERKAVLNLENRVSLRNKLETILDAIDQELNAKDELLAEFENFDDKVRDDSGKVSIAKTISAMVEAGVITKDEAKLLRKYQGELFPEPEGRDEAELQQERDNEKRFLLGVIEGLPELTHKFPTREENVLLGQFNELIKTSGIESLDNAELKNLLRVANNIENGFLPHMAEVLVEKIDAENKRAEVMAAVFNDKSGLARLYDSFLPGNLKRRAKRTPRKYIDQVWGNFRGTPLFDAVYKELAEGAAKYRSELETINARMSVREDKLFKALSRDPNAITRAKFLVSAYMMQKEFESSKGMPGVFSAVDLLDATINQKGRTQARYSEESKQVLRSIRDQIEGRTADEIESLIRDEKGGEQMMAVAKEIRDINDELTPKAQYTASVIRGVKFVPFSQYFHRIVLTQEGNQKKVFGDSSLRDVLSDRVALQPSTKAVNIQEREKGSPMAVSFDPFASVNRGAKNVLTDYHLTKPVRTNKRLLKKLQDVEVNTARQDNMLDIIIDGSTTAVEDLLIEIVNQSTMASKAFDFMRKQGYRNALGSPRRAVTELLSNAFYAVFVDHGSFLEGTKYRNIYTGSGAKIMRNTNSLQTTRLFPGLEGSGLVDRKGGTGGLNSMGLDQVSSSMSPTRAEIRNGALNLASRVLSQTAGRAYRLQADAADYMITTPDKVVSRPIWFGTFAREFESVTGKKPDMDKIADGDNQYLEQYRGAIETAKVKADDASIKAGATDNSVLGVEAASMRPDKGALQNMIAFVNNYMTRFLVFEYVTARTAVNAMVGNGMIRKRDGVRLLSGVFARAYSYQLIGRYLSDAIAALLYGDDDDLEEKDFLERSSLAVKQGAAGLVLGGTRGQATRGIRAMFLELGNRDFLMENPEEWDYDKRIGYPIIDINKESQLSNRLIKSGIRYTGPFSPVVGAGYQVLTEQVSPAVGLSKERKDKQRELEEDYRSMLLLISASGVLPLAPEIKSNVQRWMYKDIDKKKSKVIRVR